MLWIALTLLGLAIALWYYSRHRADEVIKLLALSFALVSLLASLVAAPWPMKFFLFAGLLVYPTCASTERAIKSDCPRYCLMQHQCRSR